MADSIGSSIDIAKEQRDKQLDTEIARRDEEGKQEMALADEGAKKQMDLADRFMASEQPFTGQQPHEQIQNIMSGAPWLMALVALGGAAGKLNGQAMMDGLNGVSDGLIKGDQEGMERSWQRYNAEYQKWKDRSEEQFKIYGVLSQAYGTAMDGRLRAMQAAHAMTNDIHDKKLQADDPLALLKMRSEMELHHAQATKAYADAKDKLGGGITPRTKQIDAEITIRNIKMQGTRTGKVYWQRLQDMSETYPDKSPREIVDIMQDTGFFQRLADTELSVAGRKEAAIGQAREALNMKGGIWDQIEEAAKPVDFGDAKFKNQAELALQGKVIANKDIQYYVTKIIDGRQELAQIFTRTGVGTDLARHMAEEALPLASSREELNAARRANVETSASVLEGSQQYERSVMDQARQRGDARLSGGGPTAQAPKPTTQRKVVRIGTSKSTGLTYVTYDDGTTEPIGPQ